LRNKDNNSFGIKKFFFNYFTTIFVKNIKMARKKIDDKEKITLVKCWVKAKNIKKAQIEADKISKKYS